MIATKREKRNDGGGDTGRQGRLRGGRVERHKPGRGIGIAGGVRDFAAIDAALQRTVAAFGPVDIVLSGGRQFRRGGVRRRIVADRRVDQRLQRPALDSIRFRLP
jgi:NAD(P)-dependent dehydrogenase (short-subunit alcohol dehydrogenase family)